MLKTYLKNIFEISSHGDATEETYYSVLKDLLNRFAESTKRKNIHVIPLPKKTEAGNPDFRVWDGKQHIVGYIEAKAPTVDNLNHIEDSEQLERYRHTFPNLILTNFFEFRLYRNGDLIAKTSIARPFIVHKLKTIPPVENEDEFFKLVEMYFAFSLPKVYDAKKLAVELAKRTRFLKDEVVAEELKEEKVGRGFILGFYEAFQKYLISGLTKEDFADLYSQTITYGLFAARTRSKNSFNRKLAYANIPHTIGILRDVFRFISLEDIPQQMEWIVDDISEVLAVTDVSKILHQYFHEGRGRDPIVHFYETFLTEYDPQTREKRGVYYTPEPVVSYIVSSIHQILKNDFQKPDGLANKGVTVLDPAAGTLTFMAEAAKCAVEEFVSKYGDGAKDTFIQEHVLENYYAFELMMAPYAVGHLKVSFLLEELGYRLKEDDRFKLYLTNTLEMEELAQTELPGMASLSEESHLAGTVKKEKPILVILGNPPYSGHSANRGEWIDNLLKKGYTANGVTDEGYYVVDGKPLEEKNPKWLQDDYVKFIRFAQWKIDQSGEGMLGFITNHSYLDNPTFRGMRQSLMNTFDVIYLLDLHGNSLKKEKSPDGSKDENVFDIRQGVAIALMVKRKGKKRKPEILHSEIWGLREEKYDWLLKHKLKKTKWKSLNPKSEFYLFIPRDERLLKIYEKSPKVTDIFPISSVGVVTSRDSFVIDADRKPLERRISMFLDKSLPDELIRQTFNLKDKSNWKVRDAREKISQDENWRAALKKILYRPFDIQWICYHDELIERSRKEVMNHMLEDNISLCIGRAGQVVGLEKPWNIVFCSKFIEDFNLFYRGGNVNFPLYIYPQKKNPKKGSKGSTLMLFEPEKEYGKLKRNLDSVFVEKLNQTFENSPTPESVLHYIYAILHSNSYRIKYSEFLRIDFPRIPFTKNYKLFKKMGVFGEELIDLHLVKSKKLDNAIVSFHGKNGNKVEKLKYEKDKGGVCINSNQYFEGVEEEIWEYQIGGYQVCHKWLKDRKGRTLSLEEIKHYCKVVTAIHHTIKIQEKIDEIYDEVEKEIITF